MKNNEDLYKEYQKLEDYYIPCIEEILYKAKDEVDELTLEILDINRRSNLYFFIRDLNFFTLYTSKKNYILHYSCLSPKAPISILNEPLLVQAVKEVIKDYHNDIPKLVKKVILYDKKKNVNILANLTLPGLFGNFSSLEYLDLAYDFYSLLLKESPYDKFKQFSLPFFNNASCYTFYEQVFNTTFLLKSELINTSEKFIQKLIDVTSEHIRLLPHKHLRILNKIMSLYNRVKMWSFICEILLLPNFKCLLRYSPCSINVIDSINQKEVSKILRDITNKTDCEFHFPKLPECIINHEIPKMFVSNKSDFEVMLILSIYDIKILIDLKPEIGYLQSKLEQISSQFNDEDYTPMIFKSTIRQCFYPTYYLYPIFLCTSNIFYNINDKYHKQFWNVLERDSPKFNLKPHNMLLTEIKSQDSRFNSAFIGDHNLKARTRFLKYVFKRSIYKISENNKDVEEMLKHKQCDKDNKKYKDTCISYLYYRAFESGYKIYISKVTMSDIIGQNYWHEIESQSFGEKPIGFWFCLLYLNTSELYARKKCKREFESLELLYDKYIRRIEDKVYSTRKSLPEFISRHVSYIGKLLRLTNDQTQLFRRIIVLFYFVEQLTVFAECSNCELDSETLLKIFALCLAQSSSWIYSTTILLDTFLFDQEKSKKYISETLSTNWKIYNTLFIKFLGKWQDNRDLIKGMRSMGEELMNKL